MSIEEAWNLPISAEMSSRQQQQQQNTNQTNRSNSQSYQKNFQSGAPQGPPPPYPSPNGPNKRFKTESNEQKSTAAPTTPAFYLTSQQLQLMQYLQQNVSNLTPAQQVRQLSCVHTRVLLHIFLLQSTLQQLQHQYRLMQQHQQQLRAQRQTTPGNNSSPVITRPGQTNAFNGPAQSQFTNQTSQNNVTPSQTTQIKLHQPLLNAPVPICSKDLLPMGAANSSELDVSEEDLKDLFSQKDLATTLAENLLKHFGSDDTIEIKEEPGANTLSSGPFSPSNIESNKEIKQEVKERIKSPTAESVLTVKNEMPWDFDTLHPSDKRADNEYNINMDSRTILEICK